MKTSLIIVMSLVTLLPFSMGANILLFVPGFSNSHLLFNYRFAAALNALGHKVTLWTMLDWPLQNHTLKLPDGVVEHRIVIDLPARNMPGQLSAMDEFVFKELEFKDYKVIIDLFRRNFREACKMQLEEDGGVALQETLSKQHWDLILAHSFDFCPMAISAQMGLMDKFTFVTPGTFILDITANTIGLPVAPSYIPNAMRASSDHMDFMERVKNFLFYFMAVAFSLFPKAMPNVISDEEQLFRGPPHDDRPTFEQLWLEIPSLFINGEPQLDFPRPLPFGVSYLGELAKQTRKDGDRPLPPEFSEILNKPSKGVVVFSLGTIAKAKYMPDEMRSAFAEAFKALDGYEVIWRFDGEVPEVDGVHHIHVVKWLPQRDLLNAPQVKLFVTHGGYNSLLEATKAGLPLVLIPLFADQYGNGARAQRHGLGLVVQKTEVTKESMLEAMTTVLEDSRYEEKAKRLAKTLNDKIVDPSADLDYRINFLAKKRRQFPTLRKGRRLSGSEYYCFDVLTFFIVTFVVAFWLFIKLLKVLLRIAEASSKSKRAAKKSE